MSRELTSEQWANRYQENNTPWDVGTITPPIKEYIDQLDRKDQKILVPGAGNGHEAEYLFQQGFTNTYVCDWAIEPLQNLKARVPAIPDTQLIQANFFDLNDSFDLILEQTFLSALFPEQWPAYAAQMAQLLSPEGKLAGVLFKSLPFDGPPFGASKSTFQQLFKAEFSKVSIEPCYNSIAPRMGNEWFIQLS
ncbi:MAG: methyltransferase domain-containing protein [Bacteroidota bacterium]